ncbi:hypothetical protein O181_115904 [Austropuccinia psidii MF-1]|uniref:Uncharacterized protein n=1 Tax=Austropuccinia psidii MF-1 TaxID=1389203 RepID=A0A9Q3KAH3_9BASI|nr:hypothetical protein [Austropuccinia psidii MF-1]
MKELTQKIQNPQPQENKSKDTGNEPLKEVLNQLKCLSELVESPKKPQPSNNKDKRTIQNSQPFRPRYPSPPISSSYQPYFLDPMAPRLPLKCYYCLEKGHSAIRCNNLTGDLDKIIVLKRGGTYIFPNFQRIPTEGPKSAKELVRHFSKEQEDFPKKMIKGETATAIAQIEEWGNWNPPQISPENENLQINVGLRQTRQRASRQENQIQTQQEDKNEAHKPFEKKIPGAYHEEDEAEEEIRVLIPTKYKKTQEGKEVDNYDIEIISKDKNKEG